jgi:hypothetical protein
MLTIAFAGFVILGAIQGLEYLFAEVNNGSKDWAVAVSPGGLDLRWTGTVGGFAHPIGSAIVSGMVVAFMRLLVDGEDHGIAQCWRAMYERLWRVVAGQLLATVLLVLMAITVIGIPFAIYFYIAWQFVQQEILFNNCSIRDALKRSHELVRGNWWRTVRVAGVLWLIGVVTGPVLGFFLIFATLSAVLVNLIGSVVFALLIPYIAMGRTLLYFDLEARETEPAGERKRRRLSFRPRPAAGTG